MRVKELGGKPIEQHNSPNIGGPMTAHHGAVLHIAEGSYEGTISWQMNPDQRYASGGTVTTSSTWVVGRNVGEWAQMADSDRVAWCQRSGSYTWHSIELAGHAPDAPSAWQIEACAQILAWEHLTYGVPVQSTSSTTGAGLGHHSMDNDTTVEWGHDDCPGSGVIAAKPAIVARAQEIINGGEPDMEQTEKLIGQTGYAKRTVGDVLADTSNLRNWLVSPSGASGVVGAPTAGSPAQLLLAMAKAFPALAAQVAALAGKDFTDEPAIVAGVLAGLNAETIAAAIPPTVAQEVVDLLAAKLQG